MRTLPRIVGLCAVCVLLLGALTGCAVLLEEFFAGDWSDEQVYPADSEGIVRNVPIERPFRVILADPLIIMVEPERTGTYTVTHRNQSLRELYMASYDMFQDDPLADNYQQDRLMPSVRFPVQGGETYLIGIGVMAPSAYGLSSSFHVSFSSEVTEAAVPVADPPAEQAGSIREALETAAPESFPSEPDPAAEEPEEITFQVLSGPEVVEEDEVAELPQAGAPKVVQAELQHPSVAAPAGMALQGSIEGTLTAEDGPYVIARDITVRPGSTLVIEAGAQLQFEAGAGLLISGTLDVQGTEASPVIFTSTGSREPGAWKGLVFSGDSASRLDYAQIYYAGGGHYYQGAERRSAVLTADQSSPVIRSSEIACASGTGLLTLGTSSPTITDTLFAQMPLPVESISPGALPKEMTGNTFSEVDKLAVRLSSTDIRGIDVTWGVLEYLPYSVHRVTVHDGASLQIEGGVVVQFDSGGILDVRGTLTAQGTPAQPVVLTGAEDRDYTDPALLWHGVLYQGQGGGSLEHTRILHAGESYPFQGRWHSTALLAADQSQPVIRNSEIASSSEVGLAVTGSAAPKVERTLFSGMEWPVISYSPTALPKKMTGNRYRDVAHLGIRLGSPSYRGVEASWTVLDNLPYSVHRVTVHDGASLQIEGGVVVKFDAGGILDVRGTVNTLGSASRPVILTSVKDPAGASVSGEPMEEPQSGAWHGVLFHGNGAGTLDYTRILYSGEPHPFQGRWYSTALLAADQSQPVVRNSELAFSGEAGLAVTGSAAPKVERTLLSDMEWPVISYSPTALPSEMTGNRYRDVAHLGIRLGSPSYRGVEASWTVLDNLPYSVHRVTVHDGASLQIEGGVVVKFDAGGILDVRGTVNTLGSASQPVILTSVKDPAGVTVSGESMEEPQPGSWHGILFQGSGGGDLDFTRILYAGESYPYQGRWMNASIVAGDTTRPVIRNSEIARGIGNGLNVLGLSSPVCTPGNSFGELGEYGIFVLGEGSVDARRAWWGDPSGPQHSSNPDGKGLRVSDKVQFLPVLDARPR